MEFRRPILPIAIAYIGAILISYYFGRAAAAGAGCLLAGLVLLRTGKLQHRGNQVLSSAASVMRPVSARHSALPRLLLLAFVISLLSLWSFEQRLAEDPAAARAGETITMEGIIEETTYHLTSDGERQLRIRTRLRKMDACKTEGCRVLVQAGEEITGHLTNPAPGTVIRFTGELRLPQTRRNPGCFDYRLYLKTFRICAAVRADRLETVGRLRGVFPQMQAGLFRLREAYLQRLEDHAGEKTSAMLRAILFGDKGLLEEDAQELFRRNGTAHILAVSGLHVGMLYAGITALWDLLAGMCPVIFGCRRGKRFFCSCAAFFTAYSFLAGWAPSVVRAVCMILLHAFAQMTGRRYDLTGAAFAVGLAALIHNPYIIFRTGFQMSFLAILTLSLICPYLRRIYDGMLMGSIAIQIGLGPYMILQFNNLPLIAVFINVPVIFMAGILVPAGMAGMILPLGQVWYDQGLAWLCRGLVWLNELGSAGPVSSVTVASPPLWTVFSFYLGLLVFASEEGRRQILRRRHLMIPLTALVLASSLLTGHAADDGFRRMDLVFVDVGQGDCMHLRTGAGNYLIDGGGSRDYAVGTEILQPYLLKNGVSHIDGAFVSHLHTDHYQGICELAKAGMIRRIYVYEANRLRKKEICQETGLDPPDIVFLRQGQAVSLGKGEDTIEILWPEQKTEEEYHLLIQDDADENASSLIMRARIQGVSLLATGDLGEDGEADLLRMYGGADRAQGKAETDRKPGISGAGRAQGAAAADQGRNGNGLQADILKVGHHGSRYSSTEEFLTAVHPSAAVIQVGEHNMYGHPTQEVLDRLADRRIPVWRNDLQGAVGMKLSKGRIRQVVTMLGD